jgi:hypothetical protein
VNLVDPDGQKFWSIFWAIGSGIWSGIQGIWSGMAWFGDFVAALMMYWYMYNGGSTSEEFDAAMAYVVQGVGGGTTATISDLSPLSLSNAYGIALATLRDRPECARSAMGAAPDSAIALLTSLSEKGKIVFQDLNDPDAVAQTFQVGSKDSNGNYTDVIIKINTYWDSTAVSWANADDVNGNGMVWRTSFLLHELGHALRYLGFNGGEFIQDDSTEKAQNDNSNIILHYGIN